MNASAPWGADDAPERLWADDVFTDSDERPADLVSIGFIRGALRRGARVWCTFALVGMLAGFGVLVALPPAYQASTSLLLTDNPAEIPTNAILDSQTIAQSRTVAGIAARQLGLSQIDSIVGHYTVTAATDRVLVITASATSSVAAVREANALATAFLAYQKDLLETQERLVNAQLQEQVTQAQQQVDSLSRQISNLETQPASLKQHDDLSSLRSAHSQAVSMLTVLQQADQSNQATTQTDTVKMVQGSQVLDPAAPIHRSAKKLLLIYVGTGLIAGLALGLGIVIVRALVSDRLRQRNDVARALAAPVKLSVGKAGPSRWRSGRQGLAAAQSTSIQRIVAHLRSVVPASSRGAAALAVVPVDDQQVAALALVSLALSCARDGLQVVVADLCSGSPAARLVGITEPGVRAVHVQEVQLVVAVPEPDDVVPVGPLHHKSSRPEAASPLAAACASADLLLTLAALDPSLGGDHLAGWATDVVAVVTAGRSSAARIYAVGEMIRHAGTPLISAVLVGADKTDESLGMMSSRGADRDVEVVEKSLYSDADGFFVKAGEGAREGLSENR